MPRRTKVNPRLRKEDRVTKAAKEVKKVLIKHELTFFEGFGVLQGCMFDLYDKGKEGTVFRMFDDLFNQRNVAKTTRKKPVKKKKK